MISYFEISYFLDGKRAKTTVKAPSRRDAMNSIRSKFTGATIMKIKQIDVPLEAQLDNLKERYFARSVANKKVDIEKLVVAIRQIAVMTNAGISIHDTIREVSTTTENRQLKSIFEQIDEDLNAGKSFTESASNYQYQLGDVTVAMIELGETTGNISGSLSKLASMLEEMHENSKKLKSATRYPKTVIIAIAVAFSILMIYVVPKFQDIFSKLGADLPLPTKILLACSNALTQYGLLILLAIVGVVTYHKFMYNNNELYKKRSDQYYLKIYLIGKLIFYASLSRFMLIFTELVRAGVPVAESLDTAVLTLDNEEIREKLSGVKVQVEKGSDLTEAFRSTELFEGMLLQMIKAGESGGALDKMLENVSNYYRDKFNDIIDNISTYIEPLMIGVITGMVIMLALGIFMPMWDMASAVKG
jgi:general secretion pathway protein F/MSHA biogenesis protein MshG